MAHVALVELLRGVFVGIGDGLGLVAGEAVEGGGHFARVAGVHEVHAVLHPGFHAGVGHGDRAGAAVLGCAG